MYNQSDAGNAQLFVDLYKQSVRYDHPLKRWLIWDKHWWKPDDDGFITRLALLAIAKRRDTLGEWPANQQVKELQFILRSEQSHRLKGMLDIVQAKKPIATAKLWDQTPHLLGVANGVVDLRTGRLIEGKPDQRITFHCPYEYDPAAVAPTWVKALTDVFEPDLIPYFQTAVGYSVTGEIKEQCLFCLFGEGSNGKSTLTEAIVNTLGPYAYTMPFSTLEFSSRANISNDVASLVGRRFVVASETQENIRLNEGRIKSLTGDGKITARFLHKEYFTFALTGKYWLAFNHKPHTSDDTHGFWRRIRLITLGKQFTERNCDPEMSMKLAAEAPGILAWIVEGSKIWYRDRLQTPIPVITDTANYRAENDALCEYFEERLELAIGSHNYWVSNSDIWNDYLEYVKRIGERFPLGRKTFSQRLERKGLIPGKAGEDRARVWFGAELKSVNKADSRKIED